MWPSTGVCFPAADRTSARAGSGPGWSRQCSGSSATSSSTSGSGPSSPICKSASWPASLGSGSARSAGQLLVSHFCWQCHLTSHSTTPHPMSRARRWYTVVTLLYDLCCGLAIFYFKWERWELMTSDLYFIFTDLPIWKQSLARSIAREPFTVTVPRCRTQELLQTFGRPGKTLRSSMGTRTRCVRCWGSRDPSSTLITLRLVF